MAAPQSTPLPVAPQRNEAKAQFTQKVNAFVAALEPFRQEVQDQADYVETELADLDAAIDQAVADATQAAADSATAAATSESNAAGSESAALGYRNEAEVFRNETENARDAALALVNFAGKWEDLTGALNTPATVFHLGSYWNLLTDLADVTASEPANDNADWLFIYTNAELRRSLLEEATLYADFENGDYRLYEGIGSGVVRNKAFSDLFDFTRGSTATGWGVGTLETVAVDVARFVYSPELRKRQGLQIEESQTRLNTVAAAPTVAENVTVTAVAHTISFYGTGEVVLSGAATGTLTGTGGDERVDLTFTPTAGTLTLTPSGDVVDLQLEVGSFATSVIRGESSTQTRATDNCSRTLGEEFNNSEFTMLVEMPAPPDIDGEGFIPYHQLGDGSTDRLKRTWQIFRSVSGGGLSASIYNEDGTPAATVDNIFAENYIVGFSFKASGLCLVAINGIVSSGQTNKSEAANLLSFNRQYHTDSLPSRSTANTKFILVQRRALSEAEIIPITQPEAQ